MADLTLVQQELGAGGQATAPDRPRVGDAGTGRHPVRSVQAAGLRRRLVAADAVGLAAAWLTLVPTGRSGMVWVALTGFLVTLATARAEGLHRSRVCAQPATANTRILIAAALGLLAARFVQQDTVGGPLPLVQAALALAGLRITRWGFDRWLDQQRAAGRHLRTVVLVGAGGPVTSVLELLATEPQLGYRVGAVVDLQPSEASRRGLPGGDLDALPTLAEGVGASGVVLVAGALDAATSDRAVRSAMAAGLHVQLWPGVGSLASSRLRMSPVSRLPMLYLEPQRRPAWELGLKRLVDVVLAMVLLVLTAPLMLVVAILIKREDGGPVFYNSERVGRHGRSITMTKLRTMVPRADDLVAELAELNERQGGPLFKVDSDPRLTRIGRFLRDTSIDELPQLWNVVRGAMSLVGPRPALPDEVARFDPDFQRRHDMRPGITGLWQVEARDNPSFSAYRRLDLAYVDNWSLWLDLVILVATVHTVTARGVAHGRAALRRRQP